MIVCTAALLFILLIFAPFKVKFNMQIYFQQLRANVQAKAYVFTVFKESFQLKGKYLLCDGTIQTSLDVTQIDRESGKDLLKCLTFDSFFVSLQNNLSIVSSKTILAENTIAAIATNLACKLSNCQIASEVKACLGESRVCVYIAVSTNVAELSFRLLKQGVKLWTRKLARLSKRRSQI